MRAIDGSRRRYVWIVAVAIVLGYSTLWLAGHSLGGPIEGARAILSMTSDAPFQADPQPTAPISGTGLARGIPQEPGDATAIVVGAIALGLALVAIVGFGRGKRRLRGPSADR